MAVRIDESEQLDEFLQEDIVSYSPDFRAMVLKMVSQGRSVEDVARLACVSPQAVYRWVADWNTKKKLA